MTSQSQKTSVPSQKTLADQRKSASWAARRDLFRPLNQPKLSRQHTHHWGPRSIHVSHKVLTTIRDILCETRHHHLAWPLIQWRKKLASKWSSTRAPVCHQGVLRHCHISWPTNLHWNLPCWTSKWSSTTWNHCHTTAHRGPCSHHTIRRCITGTQEWSIRKCTFLITQCPGFPRRVQKTLQSHRSRTVPPLRARRCRDQLPGVTLSGWVCPITVACRRPVPWVLHRWGHHRQIWPKISRRQEVTAADPQQEARVPGQQSCPKSETNSVKWALWLLRRRVWAPVPPGTSVAIAANPIRRIPDWRSTNSFTAPPPKVNWKRPSPAKTVAKFTWASVHSRCTLGRTRYRAGAICAAKRSPGRGSFKDTSAPTPARNPSAANTVNELLLTEATWGPISKRTVTSRNTRARPAAKPSAECHCCWNTRKVGAPVSPGPSATLAKAFSFFVSSASGIDLAVWPSNSCSYDLGPNFCIEYPMSKRCREPSCHVFKLRWKIFHLTDLFLRLNFYIFVQTSILTLPLFYYLYFDKVYQTACIIRVT